MLIEVDAFTQTLAFELAGAAREKLQHARGIILDLRSNGGGDATAMARLPPPSCPLPPCWASLLTVRAILPTALETDSMIASAFDRPAKTQIPLVIS